MSFEPFYVGTCEARAAVERALPFDYVSETPLAPFRIEDPFGLRKAVVPVFRRDPDSRIYGMGTAFHVDGWGGFLTADHVIDFARDSVSRGELDPEVPMEMDAAQCSHAVLLLGIGLVYGQVALPPWALAHVESIVSITAEVDDPFASLRGTSRHRVIADLAALQANLAPDGTVPHNIPVRLDGWQPRIGEHVLAVGYPQLDCHEVESNELRSLILEGMYGAYGRITNVFPRGRDSSSSTPVFEVEADWRSGMSGGPVFNGQGEVVGVVSRSLAPDGELRGVGYAAFLAGIPQVRGLLPSLDHLNPGWRVAYGAIRPDPWHLAGVFKTPAEAARLVASLGSGYGVIRGSHRIGTTDAFAWGTTDPTTER